MNKWQNSNSISIKISANCNNRINNNKSNNNRSKNKNSINSTNNRGKNKRRKTQIINFNWPTQC